MVSSRPPSPEPQAPSLSSRRASSIGRERGRLALDDVSARDDVLLAVFQDFQEPLFGDFHQGP